MRKPFIDLPFDTLYASNDQFGAFLYWSDEFSASASADVLVHAVLGRLGAFVAPVFNGDRVRLVSWDRFETREAAEAAMLRFLEWRRAASAGEAWTWQPPQIH